MKTKHNRFVSHHTMTPVFTCRECGKKTRDTGHDEAALELCKRCLFGFYVENTASDYGKDSPEHKEAVANLAAISK